MRRSRARSLQMIFIFGGVAFSSESLAQRQLFSEFRPPEILEPRQFEFFGNASIYQTKDDEGYSDWYFKRAFLGLGIGVGHFTELNLQAGSSNVEEGSVGPILRTWLFGLRRNIVMTPKYALTNGLVYEYWKNQTGDSLNFETDFSLRVNRWFDFCATGALDFEQDRRSVRLNFGLAAHPIKWFDFGLEYTLVNHFAHWSYEDYESGAGTSVMFTVGPVSLTVGARTNPNPTRGTFFEALSTIAIRL